MSESDLKRPLEDGEQSSAKRAQVDFSDVPDFSSDPAPAPVKVQDQAQAAATALAVAQVKAKLEAQAAAAAASIQPAGGIPSSALEQVQALAAKIQAQHGMAGGGGMAAGVGMGGIGAMPGMETVILDCPKTAVGLVIGRGGENIKAIQANSGANVQIDQSSMPCKVTIAGTTQSVAAAKMLIEEKIAQDAERSGGSGFGGGMGGGMGGMGAGLSTNPYATGANAILGTPKPGGLGMGSGGAASEVLDVPQRFVGRVIGRGGETIKRLQAESGCNISLDQNFPDGVPRKVTITGDPGAVRGAKLMVESLLEDRDSMGGGMGGGGGGGMGGGGGGGGPDLVIDVDAGMVGRVIGRGGETIRMIQQNSGARVNIDQNTGPNQPRKVNISGNSDSVRRAAEMVNDLIANTGPGGGGFGGGGGGAQHVIEIDRSMIGRIIGRGGETIKGMQAQSGARIQLDQNTLKVTISGNQEAVNMGKQLVDEVMNSTSGGGGGGRSYNDGYGGGGGGGYGGGAGAGAGAGYGQQDQYGYGYPQQQQYAAAYGYGYPQGGAAEGGASSGAQGAPSSSGGASGGSAWQVHKDDQGRPYYWNSVTGASQWEKPADALSAQMAAAS